VISEFGYPLDARGASFTANAAQTATSQEGGRRSMRSSILTLLVAALGLAANATPARGESVQILGGKLGPAVVTLGPPNTTFFPKAVDIQILNLPAGWAAGAGGCHTVKHVDHPRVEFRFSDGVNNGVKLTSEGFKLDGGNKSPFGKNTLITLCRDKSGRITKVTAQLAYYKISGSMIYGYGVSAQNTSPVSGTSSVGMSSYFNFSHGSATSASSKAVNRLQLSR
jgi:hypothetical protein